MTETKHTPGPLVMAKITNNFDDWTIHDQSEGEMVCDAVYGEANARLFCAAPELLAALEMILEHTILTHFSDKGEDAKKALDTARAAIAKARGRE